MSRLVPEKRVDKNGRVVTRHVLADATEGKSVSQLPPPAVVGKPLTKADYAREVSEFLLEAAGEEDIRITAEVYNNSFSLSTLRLIHSRMRDWSERDSDLMEESLQRLIDKTLNQGDTQLKRDRLSFLLVETFPVLTSFGRQPTSPWQVIEVVYGANYSAHHNRVAVDDTATEEDREILRWMAFEFAIMKVSTSRTKEWLQSQSRWFAENMDRLMMHANTINERGTTDRDFLSELVAEDTAVSLSEGVL